MVVRRARIVALVALLTVVAAPAMAASQAPERVLPAAAHGEAAIRALGDRLPAVAAEHGRTAADLRAELRHDPALWVDETARLYYVDSPRPAGPVPGETALTSSTASTPAPSEAFMLHSRPGASRVVYLDFDGHTIQNTAWNGEYGSPSGAWWAEAYDSDGAPGTFSSTEREVVVSVWQRVAEDFAPFDVDVTTVDPGDAAITRSSSSDTTFGTRVLVSSTSTIYTDCGCGGVAYVGTYDHTTSHATYQPAWVFTRGVGTGPHNIAEAASHEAGHNLGLSHDGGSGTGYYKGHGGWAPIMGVGYYEPITQWSRGEYSGATQQQDDLYVMTTNGAPRVVDDHGSTPTPLAGSADGTISAAGDTDTFTFTLDGPATATVAVAPSPTSPNLDARLEVRGGGLVLGSADPVSTRLTGDVADGMGAELVLTLAAGTYTAVVDGVGRGTADSGYTDYGSLGRYTISLVAVPTSDDPGTGGDGGTSDPLTAPTVTVPSTAVDTVEVAWSGGAGASSYTLLRETRHPKHGRWGSAVEVVSSPEPDGTVVDTPGSGSHRYAVVASDGVASVTSAWSGEVAVTSSGSTDGDGGGGGGGRGGGNKKTLTGRIP